MLPESAKAMTTLPTTVTPMAARAFPGIRPPIKSHQPRQTQMTSVQTMVVEEATLVRFRDSNQRTKWMARNRPLRALKSAKGHFTPSSSRGTAPLPQTTGVIRATVHSSRQAAVTAAGAVENFTKIEDREMPMTPRTIIVIGRFSKNFIIPYRAGRSGSRSW